MDLPSKINTSDSTALKKHMDDSVALVLLSESVGFVESLAWSNRRLLLGTAAAAAGVAAQFAPLRLPQDRWILGSLVIMFFILYGILNLQGYFGDKDAMMMTKRHKGLGLPALTIRSRLPRFSDLFELDIEDTAEQRKLASFKTSVGSYYTQDGDFAGAFLERDLKALIKEAQAAAKAKGPAETKKTK